MSKLAVKIDQQVGFTTGSLKNPAAEARIPYLAEKARAQAAEGYLFYCTLDTHDPSPEAYARTQEGRKLPIHHCARGTEDHRIVPVLREIYEANGAVFIEKTTFGSKELVAALLELDARDPIAEIEIDGFVTEICEVSNALLLKAYFPEVPIRLDARGSAGLTPEGHEKALDVMEACQIEVIHR